MSRIKKYTHVLVAIMLASVAGGMVWYYVKMTVPGVRVVVAAERMAVGTVIDSRQVAVKDYPRSVAPGDALTSLQSVVGKTVISGTIFPGEVIRGGHITADTGSLKAVLTSVAPGREAVDLPAETAPGMKGIAVGDRVNVFTEVVVQQGREPVTMVDYAAREAYVIRIPPAAATGGAIAGASPALKGAYVIAVTPEEARKVADGIVRGKKFSLTLLPAGGGQ